VASSVSLGEKIGDASVEALTGESSEFNFGHVKPRAMFWCVVDFQAAVKQTITYGSEKPRQEQVIIV